MATPRPPSSSSKLPKRTLPSGCSPSDFVYDGSPAADLSDVEKPETGIADAVCVNQFGKANNAKSYHGGVVKNLKTKQYHAYFEWGRCRPGKSWEGSTWTGNSQEFQFTVATSSREEAWGWFAGQMASKTTKRLEEKVVDGVRLWCGKSGKDGYLIQDLATRQKGLPDASKIKDVPIAQPAKKPKEASATHEQKQVIALVQDLVGGTQSYTRSLAEASGVTPTKRSIERVRDELIPAILKRLKTIGVDVNAQIQDAGLRSLSTTVNSLVPRPIPRGGWTDHEAILNSGNLLALQQDLDAYEAALSSEDFSHEEREVNPRDLINANLEWLDPASDRGRWVWQTFAAMSNNRHGYIRGQLRCRNMFAIERPDRDQQFLSAVEAVGKKRQGRFNLKANLQPPKREDLNPEERDAYGQANVIIGIHGTRPVNISPILSTNFRLPRSLPGAQITGANFGHGVYFATDWRKSYGYTGRGVWGGARGEVRNRQCLMFLCDMIMGDAYRAKSTGSWGEPPEKKDSVFGVGGDRGHRLENDEHVIFAPEYQRIRYLLEMDWMT